jgi:hypothetical protein
LLITSIAALQAAQRSYDHGGVASFDSRTRTLPARLISSLEYLGMAQAMASGELWLTPLALLGGRIRGSIAIHVSAQFGSTFYSTFATTARISHGRWIADNKVVDYAHFRQPSKSDRRARCGAENALGGVSKADHVVLRAGKRLRVVALALSAPLVAIHRRISDIADGIEKSLTQMPHEAHACPQPIAGRF